MPHKPFSEEKSISSFFLRHMTSETRDLFVRMLSASNLDNTKGTCFYASYMLAKTLENFTQCTVHIRGGDGKGDGGAYDSNGVLQGHYWVEIAVETGETYVADIVSDQFGFDPIFFDTLENSLLRYVRGDQTIVQKAIAELEANFQIEN